ncbi:hypothetical protein AWZ03_012710 [Drosophila navojoa]|uniref:MD-2-related lipid-recognition domain-containing protein n=2 Tax=Drosophila navojoa TaxID=7232 RepID=A0A484AW34_DRONA|nr:uncharacterized protein LOC108656085 isoform X1 [Drosophila navojoa]TDG40867.1 hypothetical protein AWZ03_012710 [Drosophila navojoa]
MNCNRRVLRSLILLAIVQLAQQYCYYMKLLSFSSWDTPTYKLEMKLHERNNSMSSVTTVLEDVPVPQWHLIFIQNPSKRRNGMRSDTVRTIYNSTIKTCDFWKYIRRVNAWNNAAKLIISGGGSNMSLDCPLKRGIYTMNVIQVPPDTSILKFMYQPNAIYTVIGTVYSLNPKNGSRKAMCHYEVNCTIIKHC